MQKTHARTRLNYLMHGEIQAVSEIISLLHCFAMRQYSARRKLKAKAE